MLKLSSISKYYETNSDKTTILSDVSLTVNSGETIAITGPSGSGKSTFLRLLAGLESPSSGTVTFNDQDIYTLSDDERALIRSQNFGFIFQSFRLFPALTVYENVHLACEISQLTDSKSIANQWIEEVGLKNQRNQKPETLSGGEQQRVAIARALATNPKIILADEPTGNLDNKNSSNIQSLLKRCTELSNATLILVTHDTELAKMCHSRYELSNGQLTKNESND